VEHLAGKRTGEEVSGKPKDEHPCYLILGRPKWLDQAGDEKTLATTDLIEIPLPLFTGDEISFTYPDSMASAALAADKNTGYFDPDYHGRVFTLAEITDVIGRRGMPGEQWGTNLPALLPNYVEAQAWDRAALTDFYHRYRNRPD
jgi:hypothetical protein